MTKVTCDCTTCIYNDIDTNLCTQEYITLECECCNDYFHFSKTNEYNNEYWISVQPSKSKKEYGRTEKYGKKMEINGRIFYTESDTRYGDSATYVTDAETGVYCGDVERLKENWERYLKNISEFKKKYFENVMDLPICEYDDTKKEYIIVESEATTNENHINNKP